MAMATQEQWDGRLIINLLKILDPTLSYKFANSYLHGSQDKMVDKARAKFQTTAVLERLILWASSKSFRNLQSQPR